MFIGGSNGVHLRAFSGGLTKPLFFAVVFIGKTQEIAHHYRSKRRQVCYDCISVFIGGSNGVHLKAFWFNGISTTLLNSIT